MAKKPAPPPAPEKPKNPRARGFKPVVVRLELTQIAALKAEAKRRQDVQGGPYLDVSALVRDAIDKVWMRKK